jgi:hypothetical protein
MGQLIINNLMKDVFCFQDSILYILYIYVYSIYYELFVKVQFL